ncbi:DUF5698 domain-containing protein [Sinanaerobacter chloroacetimidivorans]|jgi:uncharacterized protein YebE (UPF0316 family)|uniref:Uncharacterized protein n=1 Tax=Sinanaerobacter chloroacetimidivorans TaxID=2818044 RepID=A0A8J7W5E7_9FIRM|nr:DUF5698 domain-containing protein [Sinanaerobacter chloroacetimidivorans]MBR0599371.1 hypothetical protein [Sinanaerobacter chloroacetimidivorans]
MEKVLLVFMIQLIYIPLLVLRTNFMVRNKCSIAAIFGFLESLIYIFGLSLVLTGQKDFLTMLTYACGFGIGICLGGFIEKKLAIGNIIVTVNIKRKNEDLICHLRDCDFHFTVFEGTGIDGTRYKFDILTTRHKEMELIKAIESYEPESFIVVSEPRKHKTRENHKLK